MHTLLEKINPVISLPGYVSRKVVFNGDAVMLMCFAHGTSKISYHWEHHVNKSDKWVAASATVDSGLLLLASVTKDHEGIYRCVACDCYSCSYAINTTTITVIGKEITHVYILL